MIVRIWEATVRPGRLDDALAWVRHDLIPRALDADGCISAEMLKSEGDPLRVVLVTRWDAPPRFEEGVPSEDICERARAGHFETV